MQQTFLGQVLCLVYSLKVDFLLWMVVSQGMVIAETKRQMHETLEIKEEEIAQLRSRLQQTTAQKEELQEQKEKAEKSGEWNSVMSKTVYWKKCTS